MRVTIETSNPELVARIMSICVEGSTKASPVWVMGEPDSSTPDLLKVLGQVRVPKQSVTEIPYHVNGKPRSGRQRHTCPQCKKGFLGHSNKVYCSKRCTGLHYYQNIIKP